MKLSSLRGEGEKRDPTYDPRNTSTRRFIWETIEEGITDAEVESQVVVEWRIPDVGLIPGLYRVRILLTPLD